MKKECVHNFNYRQWHSSFLSKSKDNVKEVTTGCGIVWEGGIFSIKTKKIDTINISKNQ